ncbi:hypothetical protein [Wujia chipingensis]|uniref:Uncharacterized protein n=1 Tax=Wujia chipingensis TaxID=2763670 RepID=A0A7G9FKQ5_9FIRM|nr:hypothetical protein [Wujia chipingensis]QNL99136.1 hypothetical protein H9Q76_10390 [Wujia chipingensis]RHO76461.1 hypothetical protein DW062_07995 [Clostridium sp. AF43-10]
MESQVKQYKSGGEMMYTGTIQSQVSLQMLDQKWQKKKQDINSKKDTEGMTQDEILLDSLERQAQTERERSATSELYTKLKTGGTLTEEEIAYLKEHDPEALAEYEKAQTEKKAYENALKNCRTKEDVQRLKLNRMGSFAAQAKEIASNPYIPKDKKVVLMQRLNNEVCMIRDAHQAFEKSRAYEELPEEQELRREAAEEPAEKMEHQKDTEQAETTETTEDSKVDNKNKADAADEEVDEPQSDVKSEMSDVYETVEIANVETHAKIKPPESPKTAGDASMARRQLEAAQTFTEITEEIERFLRRNHSGRGSFTAQV